MKWLAIKNISVLDESIKWKVMCGMLSNFSQMRQEPYWEGLQNRSYYNTLKKYAFCHFLWFW